jgi:hypothetical protein
MLMWNESITKLSIVNEAITVLIQLVEENKDFILGKS